MRDPSSSLLWPASGRSWFWRIRHSPAIGGAALVLFLVVSALWLVAASTARAAVESQPPCIRARCPQPASDASLHVWLLAGIAGAVLASVALVLLVRRAAGERRDAGAGGWVRRAAAAGLAGVLAEVTVVLLVTHVAIATAPAGAYSGEGAAAIGILGVAQVPLAVALALAPQV